MADQLALYNVALAHLGARRLASLAEPRESARVLADEWEAAVRGCLEMAPWSFATRTKAVDFSGAAPNQFRYTLPKPADWLRTVDVAADPTVTVPLDGYAEEGAAWYANQTTIWVRFVSYDPAYGLNTNGWPQHFADLVCLTLAVRCCRRLTGDASMLADLLKLREQASQDALVLEEQTAARQPSASVDPGDNRLQVYNDALAHLGRARIYALTQASETVRALNDQYRSALRWCLQQTTWGFATRTVGLTPTTGVYPLVGFANAFAKPADWVRTMNVAADDALQVPVSTYVEEGPNWYASVPKLVVHYVSSDATFGGNPALWPPAFCDLLALRLAEVSIGRLGDPKMAEDIVKLRLAAQAIAQGIETEDLARTFPITDAGLTRLQISNDALSHLGLPRIAGFTEANGRVRALNDEWDLAVRWCLQQGPWTFAIRALMIGAETLPIPTFGYTNAFLKPTDWLQTVLVSMDEKFRSGLTSYADEVGYWFADADGLFVRYISTDPLFGLAMDRWPPTFADLLAIRLAEKTAGRLGQGAMLANLIAQREQAMKRLRASDAMNTPPAFPPTGSWVRARQGYRTGENRGGGSGAPRYPMQSSTSLGSDTGLPVNSNTVPRI